jgi:hypothetical protein
MWDLGWNKCEKALFNIDKIDIEWMGDLYVRISSHIKWKRKKSKNKNNKKIDSNSSWKLKSKEIK